MSRCLIYKVHTAQRRRGLSYHTVQPLSSTFLSFFQLFFSARPAGPAALLSQRFHILPRLRLLVKHFFRLFQIFFLRPTASPLSCPVLADSFDRLPHPATVVNRFFQIFLNFSFFPVPSLMTPPDPTAGGQMAAGSSLAERHLL